MSKYELHIGEEEHWECGDGCCSDSLTDIYVNDVEIGTFSSFRDEKGLREFVDVLNDFDGDELEIKFIPERIDGVEIDWEHYLHIEGRKILCNEYYVYAKVLELLKIAYKVYKYDVDYEALRNNRFKLDEDVEVYTYKFD